MKTKKAYLNYFENLVSTTKSKNNDCEEIGTGHGSDESSIALIDSDESSIDLSL